MTILSARSARWFWQAGSVGLLVAITLAVFKPSNPEIIVILWPASIVGLADPKGLLDQVLFGLFMFGGNFLLYGAFGAVAGLAADRLRR